MRRTTFALGVAAAMVLAAGHDSQAQRGGRGGGGGGGRGGGGGGGAARGGGFSAGGYSGGAGGARTGGTVVGPAGGTRSAGSGSGSYTTNRGSTIDYGAAGRGGTTPGGVSAGKGVGGVQVTTPGGKTATHVGTAAGVAGPGGNAVGGRAGVTTGTGPGGSLGTAYKGGVAVGPGGAAAGGARAGTATGAGGTVSGATRGAAAVGPYGAAAGRATVGASSRGTYYASRTALAATGSTVRSNFRNFANENPLLTARWLGPTWRPITYGALAGYCGYDSEPVYWDYGEDVVYSGDTVSISGTEVPAAEFAQQASDLAATGKEAKVDAKSDELKPLGVFAMVGEGEAKSTNIFQLAITKDGVIRGEYYNALTDTTEPLFGSVNKETQRAAWTVADRKSPVYEVGVANLTKDETTMLVHYSKENTQQFTFVRIQKPDDGEMSPDGK